MTDWSPAQYLEFASERTRPASDLLSRIPIIHPAHVIDLGCGTGNSTELLAAKWPNAHLDALDSSESMLAEARKSKTLANWILADLATWQANAPYDVIFSNAVFQWLSDQASLLPRLMSFVTRGGAFAFQVPSNFGAPSHTIVAEVAADRRWSDKMRAAQRIQRETPERYYDILEPRSRTISIWETQYLQVLTGPDAVYRWISGTSLRPFVDGLNGTERDDFLDICKEKLRKAYPCRPDGTTLFPFKRIFVVAIKR